jgi:hypothetical protein
MNKLLMISTVAAVAMTGLAKADPVLSHPMPTPTASSTSRR